MSLDLLVDCLLASEAMEFPGDQRAAIEIAHWYRLPERAVIFDFNGTLSDDEPILLRIFTDLARNELGTRLDRTDYLARLAGRSDREILELLVAESSRASEPDLVDALLVQRRDSYLALAATQPPIKPATSEFVRALVARAIPVGIVTGAQLPDVQAVLTAAGIRDLFSCVITEEDVRIGKPDPEGYHVGSDVLGVRPSSVLVFEDSIAGITAAKSAGMTCLGVPGTRQADELSAVADGIVLRLEVGLLPV